MEDKKLPFIETIYHLRTIEQVILYTKVLKISDKEESDTVEFLSDEYEKERLNYPFEAPQFDPKAALWGAKMVYFATQLLLNREDTHKELALLLPDFNGGISASSILSADLCLRFLPQILFEMKNLDSEDAVNGLLEKQLQLFHYSNIGYNHVIETYDYNWHQNHCYQQLYLNRVWERKDRIISAHPEINALLLSNFGDYKRILWKELETLQK